MKQKQRLELTWIGKDKKARPEPRILLEDSNKSYHAERRLSDKDIFENKLIYGDNLLALKALEQEYTGKVKCIYIDPPYNTGSAFTHYDDGLEHSIWLNLMRDRLLILYNLLDPIYGSLWISIDDKEVHYIKVMLDEIFGRSSFLASNVWQKRYSRENREAIGDAHEYILVYVMNKTAFKEYRNPVGMTAKQEKVYKNLNNDPRGPWRPVPITAQAGHATSEQFYEIVTPTGKVYTPPEGRCWGLAKKTYEQLLADNRIYFGKNGDSQPNLIRYLSEVKGVAPWTWWPNEEVGHTDEAKKEQHYLFGKENAFDTPKPERLIERILHIATNPGDLILDSFAGSGTTGAVAHKMGRRWIMVELGDHAHTHIIPRMQKVIDGTDRGGISKAVSWKGGGGFRYYSLAPTLVIKDEYGFSVISDKYNPEMLAEAVCKLMGYRYNPSPDIYWIHGEAHEGSYIYVTTQSFTQEKLRALSEEVGSKRTLRICCEGYLGDADIFPNLVVNTIPDAVLKQCEWGKDDYSLNVSNLPMSEAKPKNVFELLEE